MTSAVLQKLFGWAKAAGGDLRTAPLQHFFQAPLRPITFPRQGRKPIWAATGYDPENLVGIPERFLGNGNQDHAGMYREYALTQLRMALPEAATLPDRALQILELVDASLTPAARRRMLLEGAIVMRK